jgi:hypothetical protein
MSSFRDGKVGSTPSRIQGENIEMTNSAHQSLTSVLPKLRKRIQKIQNRNENIGEQNTKAALIDPLLAALGWDVEDIDEVSSPTVTLVRNGPLNTACRTLIEESSGCEDDQAALQGAENRSCLAQVMRSGTVGLGSTGVNPRTIRWITRCSC